MALSDANPVRPRNGHTFIVGIIARISGCANQKELSLDDQVDHGKEVAAEWYDGPTAYRIVSTKGKGEALDRPELAEIEAMIRTGELDLLVVEDLGRLMRGTAAKEFCGLAVDHGTRVLAPNDGIDTADESWEEDVIAACRDHVGHNNHTSKRIKHKKMNRFLKFGGATPCEIYGYVKPPDAKTYDDWSRDAAACPVYAEWRDRLSETLNCTAVADWLNAIGVPVGPHCRRKSWDGAMVRRITRNPILKGSPGRGFKHTVKFHGRGRRISVKNPKGPVFREYPHLAFWSAAEFDDLNARLDKANAGSGRKPVRGVDPRWRVPRMRTRFPGQHAACWYCGHLAVWGGNGVTGNLMCNGSRLWRCWNSTGFSGAAAAEAAVAAIEVELAALDGFDDQFREMLDAAARDGGAGLARACADLEREEEAAARDQENLMAAIAKWGPEPMIESKLRELKEAARERAGRRAALQVRQSRSPRLPASGAELRALFAERFRGLARDSHEFGDLLRLIVPEFHVYLVRMLDGGHLLPRARARLDLSGVIPGARGAPELGGLLTRVVTFDLFEPPQREQIRSEAVRLTADGLNQRQVATRLGVTQPAVAAALKLDRQMRERGLEMPYELVAGPPAAYPRLRHHLNPKYRFDPKEGYQQPPL